MKKLLMVVGCAVVGMWLVLGADLYTVNVGTSANDGTGDPVRTAFQKVNSNFAAVVRSLGGAATNLSLHGPMVKSGGLILDGGGVFFNEGNPPVIEEAMGNPISFPGGVNARGVFSTNGFFNDAQGTNAYTWWAPRVAAQDGNLELGNSAADLVTVIGTLVGGAYSFGPNGGYFKAAVVTNTLTARVSDFGTNLNTMMVVQGDSLSNDYDDWATEHITTNGGWLARCYRTNFAVGGQTVAAMSNVFNTTIATVAPRTQDEAWLFLWGGINDLAGGASGAATYGYLTNVWRRARDLHFKVVAFTVMGATNLTAGAEAERVALNTLILSDPTLYDTLVRADLVLPDPTDGTYFADGVHPTALGSSRIAREVVHVLGAETPWTLVAHPAWSYGAKRNLVLKPSGGRVGINTVEPLAELDVAGSAMVRGGLTLSNNLAIGVHSPSLLDANMVVFTRTDYGKENLITFDHLDPTNDGVIKWRRNALDLGIISRTDMQFVVDSVNGAENKAFVWSHNASDYTGGELMRLGEDGHLELKGAVRHGLGTNEVAGSATNRVVDFNAPRVVLWATNDLNFIHATNLVSGRWLDAVVKIYAGATNRQVWLPGSWTPIGSGGTNYLVLASNKVAILSLAADGDQQTNVCAVCAVQP